MRLTALLVLLALCLPALAGPPAAYEKSSKIRADVAHDKRFPSLEIHDFCFVFEPNIKRTREGVAVKLGMDHNRNQLEHVVKAIEEA